MEPGIEIEADSYRGASIVLYDGVCAMCNGAVRFLLENDREGRFLFAPLQESFARDILSRHGRNADDLDTVGVVLDHALPYERVLVKSRAMLHVLETAGGAWKALGGLLGLLPTPALDWVYNLVARNRYRLFGRYDSCPLPAPEHRARFVGRPSREHAKGVSPFEKRVG
jgi:predicted DCC family thiol-disulfide oxidoreductase YuxK